MIATEILRTQFEQRPYKGKRQPPKEAIELFAYLVEEVAPNDSSNERAGSFAAMCLLWTLIEACEIQSHRVKK